MPSSHFPHGFAHGVEISNLPVLNTYAGQVFWVNAASNANAYIKAGSDGNGRGTRMSPFATIAYAVTYAGSTNSLINGCIIMVAPGHTETISTATAITCSVAGITVCGLGNGNSRPNITLDTATTATINVTAADVHFNNLIFTPNFADIASLFTLTTAKNFRVTNCRFSTGSSVDFLTLVTTNTTSNNADGLHLEDNYWYETSTNALSMVSLLGTNDRVTVSNNYVSLGVKNSTASLIIQAAGKIVTNLRCSGNKIYRLNTTNTGMVLTTNSSTNTGCIDNNYCQGADGTNNLIASASSGYGFFNNLYSGVAGASGFLNPTADS